ncbi:membrane integral peptidase, M50 family, putative [Plasmodium gallinaceum]|uniref:Membrane integral peptidase, M50 family, putative n=1 Tax=Plasmodium gallinaceum TaxID=5849 RepID=A0A1J1GY07_PLAGA|nr:membrane integral peptidase, M50 family, putative [Plasmodium gallinaceum]CRG97444.1 membrane integral peptidase, M50 family, putative [Plasmodium gallinaceum]
MGSKNRMLFYSNILLPHRKLEKNFLSSYKDRNYEFKKYQDFISYILSLLPLLIISVIHILIKINSYTIGNLFLIISYLFSFFFFILYYYNSHFIFVAFVYFSFVISLCLHEFAHAYVAFKCGDITMIYKGYLYLDILNYLDIFHTLIIPSVTLFITGFALPGNLYWLQLHFIKSRFHLSLIFLSGPLLDIIFIMYIIFFYNLLTYFKNKKIVNVQPHSILFISLATSASFLVDSFLLNMFPIIGFDGWGIIEPYLPYCINSIINEEIVYTYLSYICPLCVFIYFNFIETKYLFFTKVVNFILEKALGIKISHVTKGVNSFPTLYSYLRKI